VDGREPVPPGRSAPSESQQRVLCAFFDDAGRVVQLPARHAKRLVVLDYLAQSFEPGLTYTEVEVNALLRAAVADGVDVVSARRYLVDAQMLEREGGRYWRSGGSVPV
jgi:hypothetical protein